MVKRNAYIFLVATILVLSLVTDWYFTLSILFLCGTVFTILDKLGKGIVLRELVVLHAIFVCLMAPIAGYEVYNRHNHLAKIFVKYMLVPKEQYFGFVLPAIAAFALAVCWPIIRNKEICDEGSYFRQLLADIRRKLGSNRNVGIILIVMGIVMSFTKRFLPFEFNFIASLFFSACFAGLLYVYYAPVFQYKKALLILFGLFILWMAVQSGVFTIIAYMGITLFSFFFVGKKSNFAKKLIICLSAVFILFVIQNIKSAFRDVVWKTGFSGDKTELFSNIAFDQLGHIGELANVNALFPIYIRVNQGFNITLVMRRIPTVKDFDNGSRLALTLTSSLVPRFLWPDKPTAGGKESMLYFTGINITGWSTNVGPIGEAYGSFGVVGGIIFMFFLGVFIRWAYKKVFVIARQVPLIILWIPVLFFQITYSMETDTMQIFNSLLKSSLFIWILFKARPAWFGKVKNNFPAYYNIQPKNNIPT